MKDMYSFDATQELALKTYEELVKAYHRIMKRIGIPYVVAEADTGNIGGDLSHEFHIPAALGDDTLLKCNCCGYAGNVEKARHKAVDTPLPVTHIDSFNNFEDIIKIFANPEHPSEIKCSVFKVDGNKRCILFHHRDREPNSYAVKNGVKNIEEVEDEFPDMNKILSTPPENRIILFDDSLMGHQNAIREEIQKIESIAKTATTHEVRWGQFHKTRQGDKCPQENCNGTLEESKGIEIGHCFYLGKKYSSVLDAKIRNADQTQTVLEMGCYGIGVSRLISAISESQHDQKGVTWPFSVAPYRVTILPFKTEFNEVADQVYDILEQDSDFKGEQVIDNRDETAGVRLYDASMLGSPLLIMIGKKYATDKQVEIEVRKTGQRHFAALDDLTRVVQEIKKSL
jgi:prolyl-tRNA synthetase